MNLHHRIKSRHHQNKKNDEYATSGVSIFNEWRIHIHTERLVIHEARPVTNQRMR